MKTVIITRKYWGTGSLRDEEGKRCCLGFVCEAYGVPKSNTLDEQLPSCLPPEDRKILPKWLLDEKWNSFGYDYTPSKDISDMRAASAINDDLVLTNYKREELLKPIFAKHGIKLIFRGKQ